MRRLRKVLLLLQVRRLKSKAAVLRHMLRRVAPRRLVLKALGVLEGLLMLPKLLLLLLPLLLLPLLLLLLLLLPLLPLLPLPYRTRPYRTRPYRTSGC